MSKKRKNKVVPGNPGIYQNLVLDEKTEQWKEPKRGAKYMVARPGRRHLNTKKREWASFVSFAEAKEFRRGSFLQAPMHEVIGLASNRMTLRHLIDDWRMKWLPNKQLPTQIRYESYVQHFDFLLDKVIEEIKPTDIDAWIIEIKRPEYLAAHHSTRCDYSHEFTVLKGLFAYYVSRYNRNLAMPFIRDHKSMLRVREKPKQTKDLSIEQFQSFIRALCDDVMGTQYEVIFYTAVMQYLIYGRIQDAAALQYESFDFTANKIHVDKKVQWSRKAGYLDHVVDGSKSNGGKEIEMPGMAAQLFREWVLRSGIRSGLLFPFKGGIAPYRVIEYRYTKALKKAGLPFTATHILRHASLTEYYQSCRDLLATASVAGHSDLSSTEKYAKVRNDALTKNQREMDTKLAAISMLHRE